MNNNSHPVILGIETSCDDTAASVIVNDKIHSNCVATQEVHRNYGGVVPELASRKHQQHIIPVVHQALRDADIKLEDVDAIACTQGPGLLGSLLVGYTFSKGMALALDVPLINVNHIEAHILAHFIGPQQPPLPFLCLLVSGGHSQIVKVDEQYHMSVLGTTLDDAAGETFDKAGKMLGLPYPSGPEIDRLAKLGNPEAFSFATSRVGSYDYSFSGMKTSILYFLRDQVKNNPNFIEENLMDLCASIQHTIVSYLMSKYCKALVDTGIESMGIAGGVAANTALRKAVQELADAQGYEAHIPAMEYCTDNAAMIAQAGAMKYNLNEFGTLSDVCFTRYESN